MHHAKKKATAKSAPALSAAGKVTFSKTGKKFYYRLDIKPNGILEEYGPNGEKYGEGEWTLDATGKIFTAHVVWSPEVAFSMMGAFNDAKHKMTGNWGYDNSATDGGTWQLSKKN
ncbi:MAG: hypothetical protein NVV59_12380 [Chitinophagaceae bacterium]|nr:hypothetical protein [Chitinophagaceae bacterium]